MTTSSARNMKAKLFVYLDEYKMYSISSQLFEGLTEEIIQYQSKKEDKKEEQQGPLGSGRLLGDIISESNGRAERRFLFDYAYTIFESRILDENLVSCISEETKEHQSDTYERSFVKVTGRIKFNDYTAVQRIIESFNKLNEAMQYVSTFEERNSKIAELRIQMQSAESKLKKELHEQIRTLSTWKPNSQTDQEYTSKLSYLLDFGYGDHLEAQMSLYSPNRRRSINITAILNRECMRESMAMEIKKYSRRPDQYFTILGVVTQRGKSKLDESNSLGIIGVGSTRDPNTLENKEEPPSLVSPNHLKTHISSMMESVAEIESGFTGCLENEIIIDPIAIYREV
jgi:hypothetical protein